MLDVDTRRRIDTARDILVGKVPDPKSQVEQITIALIYKFMDDMDAMSEELGGRRSFFAGEFEHYRWTNLMHSGLGGHEMLNRYAEAITRMPENPGIPPLFRSIFNNAFLPYRDPETLRLFLREIDGFSYDHSERLGDAFEYLLSVLGSQGDAGQFRTPRHIIDFIVGILDPKKDERVLDPACGTAGFLISAYRHVLNANADGEGGTTLTPDERSRLARNFTGYDISPDMVRLSLVNMYLHGFADPRIYEYDTLTSEERWGVHADVILANPPFMNPKGGIRPHGGFLVKSTRSEVLFVDYMAEHLTPNGRAGIIVPEGIIFQSQGAHTKLRRMLVPDYLIAVISLPAGVFNPYSGVKTSILILDKALARRTSSIAFFKVENDGYDLGAQRREVEANDLPAVHAEIAEYLRRARAGESLDNYQSEHGLAVARSRIAENGDYNLSAERYRVKEVRPTKWPVVRLGDVMQTVTPPKKILARDFGTSGRYPVIDQSQNHIAGWTDDEAALIDGSKGLVIFGDHTCSIKLIREKFAQGADGVKIIATPDHILPEYLYFYLLGHPLEQDGYKRHFGLLKQTSIPLPLLDVQREIVAEIEGYQRVIDGARAVLDGYRPHVPVDPLWPLAKIRDIASVESGYGFPVDYQGSISDEIPFLKVSDMNLSGNEIHISSWNNTVSRDIIRELKARTFPAGTVIFPKIGAAIATNKKRILSCESTYDNNVMGIVPHSEQLLPSYLHTYLLGIDLSRWASEAQPPSMRKTTVEDHAIPLPPLEVQQSIVDELEAEQALVKANRELIVRMESRIASAIGRVWGEPS